MPTRHDKIQEDDGGDMNTIIVSTAANRESYINESQLLLTDIFLPRDIKCMNAFLKRQGLDFSDALKQHEGFFPDT